MKDTKNYNKIYQYIIIMFLLMHNIQKNRINYHLWKNNPLYQIFKMTHHINLKKKVNEENNYGTVDNRIVISVLDTTFGSAD